MPWKFKLSWKNREDRVKIIVVILSVIIIGGIVVSFVAVDMIYSSDILTSSNATWHSVGSFSNADLRGRVAAEQFKFDIRGQKFKVTVNASLDPAYSNNPNSDYNFDATLDTGGVENSKSGSISQFKGLVTHNNPYLKELTIKSNHLYGTLAYHMTIFHNDGVNWTVNVYDYY